MKLLINDTSYHSNQREPHYPGYLIHQHLKITKTSPTRPESTEKKILLGIPNITRTTPNPYDSGTETTTGMYVPMCSHNLFGCYCSHEIMRSAGMSMVLEHNSRRVKDATSFPGSSLFLPRESTLVSAGHVAPKIWVLTRMCHRGGVAKCKIVTSVRMVESTGGDVSFFRNICGDKNSFYRQVFLHYI